MHTAARESGDLPASRSSQRRAWMSTPDSRVRSRFGHCTPWSATCPSRCSWG